MDHKKALLEQIVHARESIRRKYNALNMGREIVENTISKNLKPLTDPLEKIVQNLEIKNENKKKKLSNIMKNEIQENVLTPKFRKSTIYDDAFQTPNSSIENSIDSNETIRNAESLQGNTSSPNKVGKYLNLLQNDKKQHLLDNIVRKKNNKFRNGDSEVIFENDNIILNNSHYLATDGLLELLFKKNPEDNLMTDNDKSIFINIVDKTLHEYILYGDTIKNYS